MVISIMIKERKKKTAALDIHKICKKVVKVCVSNTIVILYQLTFKTISINCTYVVA